MYYGIWGRGDFGGGGQITLFSEWLLNMCYDQTQSIRLRYLMPIRYVDLFQLMSMESTSDVEDQQLIPSWNV